MDSFHFTGLMLELGAFLSLFLFVGMDVAENESSSLALLATFLLMLSSMLCIRHAEINA